ncbi:MAG: VWA domain-containing protein [Caldilineaceae bacterium]|nr:VWA domain-containing protein [Caldilineaceae bacterium]
MALMLLIGLTFLIPSPLLAHGVTPPQDPSPLVAHGTDKRGLLALTLRTDRPVAPGETVTLLVDVSPTVAADALTVQWYLPDGGELTGSAETLLPRVPAQATMTLQRQVRFPSAGVYVVSVNASYGIGAAMQVTAATVLVFTVQPDGNARVTHYDPRIDIRQQRLIPTTVTVEETAVAADANGDPCFTINGVVTRLDRRPIPNSPAGVPAFVDSRVPVRNVPVDMMEEDTLFDDYYGTRLTDANGNFNFSFCDDDGWFDDELELYVIVRAEMWDGQGRKVVEVEDSSWIDEVHEFESGRQASEGGTLRFDMEFDRNYNPANLAAGATFGSEVFNIADAIYSAWLLWNANGGAVGDDAIFADAAEVHYEPDYGDDGSYFDPFWNEITIADAASDPDAWDDSVIIHEWMHFADDLYGCDDTPGGDHSFFANTGDTELAWSEGYSNYYQSVVRTANGDPNGNFYIDTNGAGRPGSADLEAWNTISTTLNSVFNEGAIAAMLWDLQDSANDGNDRVGYGHRANQEVFTDPAFESNGDIFDDTCNVYVYLRVWRQIGKPATRDTAAAVSQNVGYIPPDFTRAAVAQAVNQTVNAASVQTMQDTTVAPSPLTTDYRWWKQLTWVVDNSTSMVGPKIAGVKTVINEQLNDLNNDPKGVDFNLYTFNHEGYTNRKIFENEFYSDRITPSINGIGTTNSNDLDCSNVVYGLQAMQQALVGKRAGDLWLFTDGRDAQFPRVDTVVQQLTRQQVKGSIALLGGCASPPLSPNRLNGTETYLGNAAGPQSSGIVPYLMTSLRSGGQFLFVNPDQIGLASDILRAQLANSAGAGRWSDYVSDFPLYRWDKLDTNEYRWIDTSVAAGGTFAGQPYNKAIQVFFPQPFTIWGQSTNFGWVQDDGYILMGNQLNSPTLDLLYAPLQWKNRYCGPRAATAPNEVPCFTDYVEIFTKQDGPWFAITTTGIAASEQNRAYQVLLDSTTGEIRYQYQALATSDAGQAEIAVTDIANSRRMLVSNKDTNGAAPGMGYKFYWAPPQPAKTFTVAVDELMEGVGFMLTGYSGDFEPMVVRTPDGTAVDCADTANVICLNLGKVQYIQVNVNGRAGDWTATVDAAAPSNQGTFSFTAVAASTVGAEVLSDHSLYSKGVHRLLVKVGRVADQNRLTGWLQKPNGTRWGNPFTLYDDGAHDDLFAGDGYFGSEPITPGSGAAYLWVSGTADGTAFRRADPVPFNFQPFQLSAAVTHFSNDNDTPTAVPVTLTNGDSVYHCFDYDITYPSEWAVWSGNWDYDDLGSLCLSAGETRQQILTVYPAWYEAPSGATGEVTISFSDVDNPGLNDSVTVTFMRQRAGVNVRIDNAYKTTSLRPNGTDTAALQVAVFDEQGFFVADGTPVLINTTLGTVNPTVGTTQNGLVQLTFTAGTQEGDATIMAAVGGASAQTALSIRNPLPDRLDLVATPTDLAGDATSATLVATLLDRWGNPLANQLVRIGVSGDGQLGTLPGETEVVTLTTDGNGQVTTQFTKGAAAVGTGDVRAELLVEENGATHVAKVAQVSLRLSGSGNPEQPATLYLPLVTTGGVAAAPPSLAIYTDATAWEDWSWDSTVNLASTALAQAGSQAIAITHNASHAGFSLRSPTPTDATLYRAIRFWIYGAANGNALLLYTEASDEGPVSPQQYAFTAPPGVWTQITVPLSALGNPSVIKRVTLQENGGAAQATYFIDDLQLVGQ